MSSIGTFSGLSSGIDFRSLVDEIMKIESRPLYALQDDLAEINARSSSYTQLKSLIGTFESAAETLRIGTPFGERSATVRALGGSAGFTASAGSGAAIGSHDVRVLSLATREKVAGADFATRDEPLGLSGAFIVNRQTVEIGSQDTLADVAGRINEAFLSVDEGSVTASVLSPATDRHRLVLSAAEEGADGIDLVDPEGLLETLGFLEASTQIKHATSDGALSDAFASADLTVGEMLGLASAPSDATLAFGEPGHEVTVDIDLGRDSLTDIAAAITAASAGNVSAQVVAETAADGTEGFRLDISGTTGFPQGHAVLETLGIVEGGRGDVAQTLAAGVALEANPAGDPATTSTAMVGLHIGGAAAGVQVGDTIEFSGTLGDGAAFGFTYTVGAGDTVADLLTAVNNADNGLSSGSRTATATLGADGAIVVTDDTGGDSRLGLRAVARNENGGELDLGDFRVAESGRARTVVEGADAAFEVDGVYLTNDANTVTGVLDGVTLNLQSADPGVTARLDIARRTDGVVSAASSLVDAYNELNGFVKKQMADENAPPGGDIALRTMLRSVRGAMQETLGGEQTGGLTRLGEIGITIQSDGDFALDTAALRTAVETNPTSVERLFGVYGAGSVSTLEYIGAGEATSTGTYDVEITQAAIRRTEIGSGFDAAGGVYVDDGVDDAMTVTDLAGGGRYDIALSDGMTATEIVSALNAEFDTARAQVLTASTGLHADAGGTPATIGTTLDALHAGGTGLVVADGDRITISGRSAEATSFSVDFQVTDATTQTLGDLLTAIRTQLDGDADVALDGDGRLVVTAAETGASLIELTLSSDNEDVNAFSVGTIDVTTEGRGPAALTATEVSGEVQISADRYGSANGFEISYTAGGSDGTGILGLDAGRYAGTDVAGTIGGMAATGAGRMLTGVDGTAAEGLKFNYLGDTPGIVGQMTFSRGIASLAELVADDLLGVESGSIQSLMDVNDARVLTVERRIDSMEARLERREQMLLDRFIAMEQAIARSEQTTSALLSSLGSGVNYGAGSNE
jgi:flagellar hook-associated protein 2